MITVYGKPGNVCLGCLGVKRRLDKAGVPFTFVDVTEDREALEFVVGLGYSGVPVVVRGGDHFQGYKPDRVDEFVELERGVSAA